MSEVVYDAMDAPAESATVTRTAPAKPKPNKRRAHVQIDKRFAIGRRKSVRCLRWWRVIVRRRVSGYASSGADLLADVPARAVWRPLSRSTLRR